MTKPEKAGALTGFLLLAGVMVCLMWQPIHEESATADEPWILGAGYTYCEGLGFRMHPDEPPLAKLWSALPLTFMSVKIPEESRSLLEGHTGYPMDRPWRGPLEASSQLFPAGRDNWYYWPWMEGDRFGQFFLYSGENDADRLLTAARLMQVVLTLLTAVVIFLWANQLAGPWAGLLGCALWVFNPVALAHGHIVQTDGGGTLTILASLWSFTHFVQRPRLRTAIIAGLAFGLALTTKLSALLLLPIFVVVTALVRWRLTAEQRSTLQFVKLIFVLAASTWAVILIVYAPHWMPAPPLEPAQVAWLNVPSWFEDFRLVLIPPDFFKAVALLLGTADAGHNGYLLGKWSPEGWWYYYPVAFALKTPIAFLALLTGALFVLLRRIRTQRLEQLVPWVAAAIFFGLAMYNKMNIGVRHLLPVYGLLSVGVASQLALRRGAWRVATMFLVAWLVAVSIDAHPFYIEYFNEFAGGARNGYKYLLDSNLDWGQDVKRLKQYLTGHHLERCYLAYFGVEKALTYHGIQYTTVEAAEARTAPPGTLVISAMVLMQPEWTWLREQHQPIDRVGYTLFVYRIGD
ncbi:MAG TPA: glycosyltransferase family 39 protein [Verrucomicrobiae bacterium]|nr:glycosyltransferase family 39 protein [Verrucomicrobiae bacterium]